MSGLLVSVWPTLKMYGRRSKCMADVRTADIKKKFKNLFWCGFKIQILIMNRQIASSYLITNWILLKPSSIILKPMRLAFCVFNSYSNFCSLILYQPRFASLTPPLAALDFALNATLAKPLPSRYARLCRLLRKGKLRPFPRRGLITNLNTNLKTRKTLTTADVPSSVLNDLRRVILMTTWSPWKPIGAHETDEMLKQGFWRIGFKVESKMRPIAKR